jgi:hypothetical protein
MNAQGLWTALPEFQQFAHFRLWKSRGRLEIECAIWH